MTSVIRNNITDHPYALQTWDGPYPFLLPGPFQGEGEADVLRIRAPKSYWLYLESQNSEQVEVLRRDLNGSNGLPPLGDTFQVRVRKQLNNLKKSFLDTDWRIKGKFKDESMFISIKRHDFLPGTSMEFPRFITPPPPYGPRPSCALMRDHFPNCLPIDEEEEEELAAMAAAAAAMQQRSHYRMAGDYGDVGQLTSTHYGCMGDGNGGGRSIGGAGDPFNPRHSMSTSPASPFDHRHPSATNSADASMPSSTTPSTTTATTFTTTSAAPCAAAPTPPTTSAGDVPLIGRESVLSAEARIKTEFGCNDYRQFHTNDFSSGINY